MNAAEFNESNDEDFSAVIKLIEKPARLDSPKTKTEQVHRSQPVGA